MSDRSNWFVTTDWLAENTSNPDVAVVDASWHLPAAGRDPHREFIEAHIPGAVFFDIDAISDTENPLPHMLPTEDQFASSVGALGIDEGQKIVVYDSSGLSSSPRVWWTFKTMGARDVVILEGGLSKWLTEGKPVENGEVVLPPRTFHAEFKDNAVRNLQQLRQSLAAATCQVVDARARDRFLGEAPEPRAGVVSGRIPDSVNLPFPKIVDNGILKDATSVRDAFENAGLDLNRPIVTSCGSGITAAILTLALETIDVTNTSLFDGSWAEWGSRDDTEIAVGPTTNSTRSA